jgi:TRAP-type C4-dicarboxylate transport system substrate-binding protein
MADGVAQNVIQLGFCASIFSAGKVPEMNLLHGIPFLYDTRDQMIEVVYSYKDGAVFKLLQKAFKEKVKAYYMGYGLTGMNGLFGNFSISSIADIKGKKIRSTGAANGLIAQLGGSPITLPGSEHYTAFQRKTIDGTVYPFHAIRSYKLTEVVKNIVFPPFYPGTEGGVYCNISALEKLPAGVQGDLEKACIDWARNEFTPAALDYSAGAVDQIIKSGMTKYSFSDSDVKKLRKIVVEKVLPRYVKKTPRCKELWGLIEGYCKGKGLL